MFRLRRRCEHASGQAQRYLKQTAIACQSTGTIEIAGADLGAAIIIDGGSRGVSCPRPLRVVAGSHLVRVVKDGSVEAAGFFHFDQIVEAKEGDAPIRLDVKLTPVPD